MSKRGFVNNKDPDMFTLMSEFFKRNPTETLTAEDASVKFGRSIYTAGRTMRRLRQRGIIVNLNNPPSGIAVEYRLK